MRKKKLNNSVKNRKKINYLIFTANRRIDANVIRKIL